MPDDEPMDGIERGYSNRLRDLCPFDDGDMHVTIESGRVTISTRRTVLDGMLDALEG